jgi:hypothetical protein
MPDSLPALVLADPRIMALRDPLRATLETALILCHHAGAPVPLLALAKERRRAPATLRRHLGALARLGWPLRRREGHALWVDATALGLATPAARSTPPNEMPPAPPLNVKNDTPAPLGHEIKIEAESKEEEASSSSLSGSSLSSPTAPPQAPADDEASRREVVRALAELGVYLELAASLARLPWVTLPLVRRCGAALAGRRGVRNLPGLLIKVLRQRDDAIALARSAPRLRAVATTRADHEAARARQLADEAADSARRALQEWWRRALAQLESAGDAEIVQARLSQVRPVSVTNGVLLLSVRDPFTCDWIHSRARRPLLAALSAIEDAPRIREVQTMVARNGDWPG